jgi:hypothetical protein
MRKLTSAVLIICSVLILANAALAKGGKGGHYVGGVGSSHKGGHYVGPDGSSGYNKSGSSSSSSGSSYNSYKPRSANTSTIHVRPLHYSSANIGSGVTRDSHGRIERSQSAKDKFLKQHGYSKVPAGYEVDHIIPLYAGGKDEPSNMELLTKAHHHAKTKSDYQKYGR